MFTWEEELPLEQKGQRNQDSRAERQPWPCLNTGTARVDKKEAEGNMCRACLLLESTDRFPSQSFLCLLNPLQCACDAFRIPGVYRICYLKKKDRIHMKNEMWDCHYLWV